MNCPKSYLWIKSRDLWDDLDYENLGRIQNGYSIISRKEPNNQNRSKKIIVTKNGVSKEFDSMRLFAKYVNVSDCFVSNSINRNHKVKGYKVEKV